MFDKGLLICVVSRFWDEFEVFNLGFLLRIGIQLRFGDRHQRGSELPMQFVSILEDFSVIFKIPKKFRLNVLGRTRRYLSIYFSCELS